MANIKSDFSNGLVNNNNIVTATPENSLETAENVIVNKMKVITKTRGYTDTVAIKTDVSNIIVPFKNKLFITENGGLKSYTAAGVLNTTPIAETTYVLESTFVEANNNLYLCTANFWVKCEDDTKVTRAGVSAPLSLTATLKAGIGFTIKPNSRVAYRVLFGRTDYNNNKILGEVSALEIISNTLILNASASGTSTITVTTSSAHGLTSGDLVSINNSRTATGVLVGIDGEYTVTVTGPTTFTFVSATTPSGTLAVVDWGIYKDGNLKFYLPIEVTSDEYIYQIYRSSESAGSDIDPLEDLQLILEENITATNISNGYVDVDDTIPAAFRGAYCYTNPNQEGIVNNNTPAPIAECGALFRNTVFYGNVKGKASKQINLITVVGVSTGATIVIDGITFTASTVAENASTNTFKVTSGSGSPSFDIQETAKSLCRIINISTTSKSKAIYLSGFFDVAGQILIESKLYDVNFVITSSFGSKFSPSIPTSGGSFIVSYETFPNRVVFSKVRQPESVPLLNYLDLDSNESIINMIPLKDSLIIMTDKKVYRLNGDVGNFYTTILDSSVRIVAKQSVAVLNNVCYFLSNVGVVGCNDQSVFIVSKNIDPLFNQISQALNASAFSVVNDVESLLYIKSKRVNIYTGDFYDIVYIYNEANGSWTSQTTVFDRATFWNDKLYIHGDNDKLQIERKNLDSLDYSNYKGLIVTLSSNIDGFNITLVDASALSIGDIIGVGTDYNSITDAYKVIAIDDNTITLNSSVSQTSGSFFVFEPITSIVVTQALTGDVGALKHFTWCKMYVRNSKNFNKAELTFYSDKSISNKINWESKGYSIGEGWGLVKYGISPWGSDSTNFNNPYTDLNETLVTLTPRGTNFANWIQLQVIHSEVEDMELQLLDIQYRNCSRRT